MMDLKKARPIIRNGENARTRLRAMAHSRINAIVESLPFQRVTLLGLEIRILGSTTSNDRQILEDLFKMYDEYENMFVEVIGDGIREGIFARGDARLLTKPLLGAIDWMIKWYRPQLDTSKAGLKRLCDTKVDFVLEPDILALTIFWDSGAGYFLIQDAGWVGGQHLCVVHIRWTYANVWLPRSEVA